MNQTQAIGIQDVKFKGETIESSTKRKASFNDNVKKLVLSNKGPVHSDMIEPMSTIEHNKCGLNTSQELSEALQECSESDLFIGAKRGLSFP